MREISIEADSWQKPKCLGLALKQHSVKTQVECFSLPCFCYPFKNGGSDSPLSPQSCHLGSHGSPDLSALKILQKPFHALHVTAAHSRSPLGTHRHFRFEGMGFSHYMHHKELTEYQDPGSILGLTQMLLLYEWAWEKRRMFISSPAQVLGWLPVPHITLVMYKQVICRIPLDRWWSHEEKRRARWSTNKSITLPYKAN